MKRFTLLFVLLFLILCEVSAVSSEGYIVTLNGIQITGQIGDIKSNGNVTTVVFINDFGSVYAIHPALIKGFVYRKDSRLVSYESHYRAGRWFYLNLLYKGSELSLYHLPSERIDIPVGGGVSYMYNPHEGKPWLMIKGKPPFLLKRKGYRGKLRRFMAAKAPDLAKKIGKKGYKYEDMLRIVKEYDEKVRNKSWRT